MIQTPLDDESLVGSCLSADQDPAVKAIEQEWSEIWDAMEEPWGDQILN
jgi:hypothetical protein